MFSQESLLGHGQRLTILNLDVYLSGLPEVVHSHIGVEPGPVIDALYMFNTWVNVKESKLKPDDWD